MTGIEQLEKAAALYYNPNSTELQKFAMSDAEYDILYDYEKAKNSNHSFFKTVGAPVDSHWQKMEHQFKMGSQAKVKTEEEFNEWKNKYSIKETVIQEKLDGISIALNYKKGVLESAITRGDGVKGENIYRNVVQMSGVPRSLMMEYNITVRGEIVLYHSKLPKINKMRIKEEKEPFKNARNAASGIAKRLDGQYSEFLNIIVYDVLNTDMFKTEEEKMKFLYTNGFHCVMSTTLPPVTVYNYYVDKKREMLDHDIDGMVIKSNQINPNDDWKKPNFQIAWKFPAKSMLSTVKEIEWSVSGGRITPIAIFETIDFGDCNVSRASLSNYDLAKKLGIGVGAKVIVSRRNDVIPQVDKVIKEGLPLEKPETCPLCGNQVKFEINAMGEQTVYLTCINPKCMPKRVRQIMKWITTHEVKGVAGETVEKLLEGDYVYDLHSFLCLPYRTDVIEKLKNEDGFGERKVEIILNAIKQTWNTDTHKFMTALDLSNTGSRMMKTLIDHIYNDVKLPLTPIDIFNFVCQDTIHCEFLNEEIEGFGDERKQNIFNQMLDKGDLLFELITIKDLNVEPYEVKEAVGNLKDQSFCFTGKLNSIKRKDAEKLVQENGGKIGSVNKDLKYLVTNDPNGNSSKLKKARNFGTKLITEDEFLKMV